MYNQTLAPDLAARGYYVVTYDQRGSGKSPRGTPADFTFAKVTQDLDDLIRTLHLSQPVFIGHSWGGTVAVKYLELHAGTARGAILIGNPMDYPESTSQLHDREAAFYQKLFMYGPASEVKALHARMFPTGLTPPFSFADADMADTMDRASKCLLYFPSLPSKDALATYASLAGGPNGGQLTQFETAPGNAYNANEHLYESNFTADFTKVKDRLYAVYGAEDGLLSDAGKGRIRDVIGPAHYTSIAGAGHMPFIDQRGETLDAIASDIDALEKK